MTATIKLMNSQLPVHQIENYILPLKLGQSRIIQSYHSFIYKIEADKLFSYVNKIKEQMNLVNTTYMKKRYPPATTGYNRYKQTKIVNVPINSEHEIGKDQSMYDLIKQTKNLIHRTENKLVNIFPTLPRSKRSPLDIIGYIGNQLFGLMDHEEKQRIDNALSVIGRNQENLHKQQEMSLSLLKSISAKMTSTFLQLSENQEKISTKIKELSMDVSRIGLYQLLQNANEQLIQNNNVLFDILTELEDAIVFSNMGKVHPSVISINDIREMKNQLNSLYDPRQIITLKNAFNYYNYLTIQNYIDNKEILFKVLFPILSIPIYQLYRIYSIPHNNYMIPLAKPYLMLSNSTYALNTEICPKLEDIYICGGEPLPKDESCVLNLMRNVDSMCEKIRVYLEDTLIQQISPGDLLVYAPNIIKISYNCNEKGN